MKKILIVLLTIICLSGCKIGIDKINNTPTKKIETYMNDYQTLSEGVLDDLDVVIEKETTYTDKQKEEYRDIMKKHFKNLDYTIKDETVNGDTATVEVEIEVTDFYKALNDKTSEDYKTEQDFYNEEGEPNDEAYNNYRLDRLKNAKDTVKYTLYLSCQKDNEGNWEVNDLTDDQEQKILGMYKH